MPNPFVGNAGVAPWVENNGFKARIISELAQINNAPTIIAGMHIITPNHRFILANDLSEELQKLRDRTPVTDFSEIKEVIESELGFPLDEIFTDIDEIPIGSASIGQVHTAKLKKNGEKVAIKVQKPNSEEIIKS